MRSFGERSDRWCAVSLRHRGSPINGKSQRCRLGHVISCVQSQLITSVPPVSAHQCHLSVPISATSIPHISAYQCTSMPHISAHQSCLSVPPINASQCHLSV
ncbi:unnamed protein product, partial [Staurois parvus]